MKTLVAVLSIALLGMMTTSPLGCARDGGTRIFSEYGFSFKYPSGFVVSDEGLKGQANSESSGRVLVTTEENSTRFDMLVLTWSSPLPEEGWGTSDKVLWDHFQTAVADYRQTWDEDGYSSVMVGGTALESCSGHSMLYVYYEFTSPTDSKRYQGTIGETYCDESGRLFEFVTCGAFVASTTDAELFLLVFSTSLVCH
jgi:hypothetical protein